MFGIYDNRRLSQNERKILNSNPDDYNWYCVMVNAVFNDYRFFQVREDIEIPKKEDDDGVVLIFEGCDVVFFKTIPGDITDDEMESIVEVCSYLEDTFKQTITAYVLCRPEKKIDVSEKDYDMNLKIVFKTLTMPNGEEIIDRLENKLVNNQEFTISDSINHMLLPYTYYHDKEVFEEKYKHYMGLIDSLNAD